MSASTSKSQQSQNCRVEQPGNSTQASSPYGESYKRNPLIGLLNYYWLFLPTENSQQTLTNNRARILPLHHRASPTAAKSD